MELESDFGSSGREAAYRETGQRLQLELSGALKWLRFVESSRQLETSQALQAIAHAEREPRPREATARPAAAAAAAEQFKELTNELLR